MRSSVSWTTRSQRLGLQSHTLLVVASDHGEGLGEHEETLHGFFVYQTTLAVPLIVRGPGIVARREDRRERRARRSAADGARSAGRRAVPRLSAVGQQPRPPRSAAGPDRRPTSPQYAESLVPLLHFGWSDLRVLRRGSWKYVLAPRPELYDLAAGSARAAQSRRPSSRRAPRLFARTLANLLEQERRIGDDATARTVPVGLLERLGALGYVSGVATRPRPRRRAPIRRTRSSSSGAPTRRCGTAFWR